MIIQKSWGLFQRKLQSISGEWNLKGPNPFPPKLQIWFLSVALKTNTKRTLFYYFSPVSPFLFPLLCTLFFLGFYLFAESALAAWLAWLGHTVRLSRWPAGVPGPALPVLMVDGGTQWNTITCTAVRLIPLEHFHVSCAQPRGGASIDA